MCVIPASATSVKCWQKSCTPPTQATNYSLSHPDISSTSRKEASQIEGNHVNCLKAHKVLNAHPKGIATRMLRHSISKDPEFSSGLSNMQTCKFSASLVSGSKLSGPQLPFHLPSGSSPSCMELPKFSRQKCQQDEVRWYPQQQAHYMEKRNSLPLP